MKAAKPDKHESMDILRVHWVGNRALLLSWSAMVIFTLLVTAIAIVPTGFTERSFARQRRLGNFTPVRMVPYKYKELHPSGSVWMNPLVSESFLFPVSLAFRPASKIFVGVGCGHCGSTSLYCTLMQHPLMVPGKKKELLYLNEALPNRTAKGYISEFPVIQDWQMTGEFSPYYLSSPSSPELLSRFLPDAKVLMMLRDPLAQCRSAYSYIKVRHAMETEPSCDFYKILAANDTEIRKLWQYHPCDTATHYILGAIRWLSTVPKNNILILDSDEFRRSPLLVLRKIESFLGLPHFDGFGKYLNRTSQRHETPLSERVEDVEDLPQAHCFAKYRQLVESILQPHRIHPHTTNMTK